MSMRVFGERELRKFLEWAKAHSRENKKRLLESQYGTLIDGNEGLGFIPKPSFFQLLERKGYTTLSLQITKISFKGVLVLSIDSTKTDVEPDI